MGDIYVSIVELCTSIFPLDFYSIEDPSVLVRIPLEELFCNLPAFACRKEPHDFNESLLVVSKRAKLFLSYPSSSVVSFVGFTPCIARSLDSIQFSDSPKYVRKRQSNIRDSQGTEATPEYIIQQLVVEALESVPFEYSFTPILIALEKFIDVAILRIYLSSEFCKILLGCLTVRTAAEVVKVESAGIHKRAILAVDCDEVW